MQRNLESLRNLLAQAKGPMSNPSCVVAKLWAYGYGDLNFRGTDHEHIDAGVGQGLKKCGSNSGMRAHADPHYRDLDDVRAPPKLPAGSIRKVFLERLFGPKSILGRHGKVKFAFPLRATL